MTHTEHDAQKPAAQTGLFAMLSNLLPARGSGAPSARASALVLAAAFSLALLAPSAASAHFVRPFLHQTTGGYSGLAVDAEDHLWAGPGPGPGSSLDRFEPSGAFEETLSLPSAEESAQRLAIDPSTGAFYISAQKIYEHGYPGNVEIFSHAGALQHIIGESELGGHSPADLAFDPSSGSLYVVNDISPEPDTIFKFDAAGAKASFGGCLTCGEYVSGNQITGAPGAKNKLLGESAPLATDPASGDIYVYTERYGEEAGPAVLEYAPSGEFLHAITSEGVPKPPGSEYGYFGGNISALAVDPSNGDLLLSLGNAVDEFDSSGHFLGQITAAAGQPLKHAGALALDSTGRLYLAAGAIDAYGSGGFVPALRLAAPGHRGHIYHRRAR